MPTPEGTNGAEATFADGTKETWVANPDLTLSGEAVAAFLSTCLKPEPVSVEPVIVSMSEALEHATDAEEADYQEYRRAAVDATDQIRRGK